MKDKPKKNDLAESLLVSLIDLNPQTEDFLTAVMDGLSGATKALPCKFFMMKTAPGFLNGYVL